MLDTTLFANGVHRLKVVVRDAIGLATSAEVAAVFENALPGPGPAFGTDGADLSPIWVKSGPRPRPPVVSIREMAAPRTTPSGRIEFVVMAADDDGLDRIEVFADNILVQTAAAAPFLLSLDTGVLAEGPHTISVVAYDLTGLTSEARLRVHCRPTRR